MKQLAQQAVEGECGGPAAVPGFSVDLEVYSGPFDALLSMLANKRLELTELSLSAITEEFLAYLRRLDLANNMEEASAFLDVASILVEAKSAALLPNNGYGQRDDQSMEALRERDLLFARLVQYRAFKQVAADFQARLADNSGYFAHPAFLDIRAQGGMPVLAWTVTPQQLAKIAALIIVNAPANQVAVRQLHVPQVDLQRQFNFVRDRLRSLSSDESLTFKQLTDDTDSRMVMVARFLSLLLFFKQGLVQFKQTYPFEELHVRWVFDGHGTEETSIDEKDFV